MGLGTTIALLTATLAQYTSIRHVPGYSETCDGFYASHSWPGSFESAFSVGGYYSANVSKFAFVVYRYKDRDMLGVPVSESRAEYICTNRTIAIGLCSENDYGRILLSPSRLSENIISLRVDQKKIQDQYRFEGIGYDDVLDTDAYCFGTVPVEYCSSRDSNNECVAKIPAEEYHGPEIRYESGVKICNPFGYLPASKGPLMTLHFFNAGVYSFVVAMWLIKSFPKRKNLIMIQYHIPIMGILAACAQALNGFFYVLMSPANSKDFGILWFLAFLRASSTVYFLFFLLLLSLEQQVGWNLRTWRSPLYWVPLGAVTFMTSVFYVRDACYVSGDGVEAELYGVKVVPILTALLLLNFVWIIQCLSRAPVSLEDSKLHAKAAKCKKILKIALIYAISVFMTMVYLMIYRLSGTFKGFMTQHWRYKWLFSDGISNILYLFFYGSLAYHFQPSSYEQLPQDENVEEFEIDSFSLPKVGSVGNLPEELRSMSNDMA